MKVGRKIKEERMKKKIKQIELAKKVGISNTFLSDIEVGRSNPSIDTLRKIAEVLEVSYSELLD
ncbi:helix-turn-helix domain-containing protein [Metaclostridioides mangenotii]|uniref:helix-turn-helix domain-containing protein n=1 Tax=Metaclostridioides mangenotii TaxID=1540 RepID=UPI000466B986|nr:helix-turn-helix transcriptional regulator [Clostridioides mangenotii]